MQGKNITFLDIKKRLITVDESTSGYAQMRKYNESAYNVIKSQTRPDDIVRKIKSGCEAKFEPPMDYLVEMYNALYENSVSNSGQIIKASRFIAENAIPKVKNNATSLQDFIKRKMAYMRSKHKIKVNRELDKVKNNPENNDHHTTSENKKQKKDKKTRTMTKEEAFIFGYSRMLEEAQLNSVCYRIIDNYNKLSKRFNIDALIIENTLHNGVYDTVLELCVFVDTYRIPSKAKFNAVLESAFYGFNATHTPYTKKEIIEAAVDYFGNQHGGLEMCRSILEDSMIYKDEEMPLEIEIIHEEEPEDSSIEENIPMEIEEHVVPNVNYAKLIFVSEETDFNKVFAEWKKNNEDSETKSSSIKSLISKLYVNSPNQVVSETPNLLRYFRGLIIIAGCAIHPIISGVLFIADQFVSRKIDSQESEKMLKCFENEIKATNNKINSCKDVEELGRLKQYKEACEKAKNKINLHLDDIVKDREIEDNYDEENDDFGFDSDFFEFAYAVTNLLNLVEEVKDLHNSSDFPHKVGSSFLKSVGITNIYNIAEFVKLFPEAYDIDSVKSLYEDYYNEIANTGRYREKSALRDSIEIMSESSTSYDSYNIYENCILWRIQRDGMRAIQSMVDCQQYNTPLSEASFLNNLKTASYNLSKSIKDLSQKEQIVSRKLDSAVRLFLKKAQDAITNDNRESVIRGSLIPSANKLLKTAFTTAAAGLLFGPQTAAVGAVIGVLAYIAVNKKCAAKQRQLIIDEVEVELKMCDKYIEEAESKNDKEALRQLYKIQRQLQRTQQRVKYKMHVSGQPVHDIPKAGY